MKTVFGIILCAIAILGGLYISIWWGIIQPIYSVCTMIDGHSLTAMSFAGEVVKFFVRDILAVIWFAVFWLLGVACIES